jgi:thioesterase domain-containing protein
MKGLDDMSEAPQLSEARRALLEKYMRGDLLQAKKATVPQNVKAEATSRYDSAVAIQMGGSRRPFFYLHGEWRDGNTFYCYPLAHTLGEDQPFYVLEPYTFAGLRVPPTLEAIAKIHLKALYTIQPEGPYLLGGWCNGALVAYEMARQLYAQGQTVDLLVLMDSLVPGSHKIVRSVISRLGGLMRLDQEKQLDWFISAVHVYRYLRFARYRQRWHSGHAETAAQDKRGRGKVSSGLRQLAALFPGAEVLRQDYPKVFEWVNAGYAPDPYPGKITFFWVKEEPGLSRGWRGAAEMKEAEVYIIPGNDLTSRTEHLQEFAEQLCACLSNTQTPVLNK